MMTKQEEREMLTKIEGLLNKCDPDGYIMAAFAGVVADAWRNIDEDAAYSMRDRYESAEDRRAEAAQELVKVRAELAEAKKAISESLHVHDSLRSNLEAARQEAEDARRDAAAARSDALKLYEKQGAEAEAWIKKAEALEAENIRLKARCFDLMEAAR